MRYFLDTEFIEEPCSIDLISIGIVSETGREFYAISNEFDPALANDWVQANVLPNLGVAPRMPRKQIAQEVLKFMPPEERPEIWGYFSDYDWVVFCWLFGPMVALPKGYPFWCRDLKQLAWQFNVDIKQEDSIHNALDDARWIRRMHGEIEGGIGGSDA